MSKMCEDFNIAVGNNPSKEVLFLIQFIIPSFNNQDAVLWYYVALLQF